MALRVSITIQQPRSEATYVVLATEVAYIQMVVAASADMSGRFRFIPESIVTNDGKTIAFSKSISDQQSLTDSVEFSTEKSLESDAYADDSLSRSISKGLEDAPTVQDLLIQAVSKVLPPDSYQVQDLASLQPIKGLSSSVDVPGDFVNFMTYKVLGDTVEILDEFERLLLAIRESVEDQPVTDAVLLAAIKPLVDSISLGDDSTLLVEKNFADGFALNDGTEAGDGSTYSFSKGVSNVALVGDAASLSVSRSAADSFGLSDGGLVTAQNYCDITYFAEDYVGVSTTF